MANQTETVNQVQPAEQCQIEAAKLLKDWSTWLVTVQAAALGLITIFFGKDQAFKRNNWSFWMVICFALSISLRPLSSVNCRRSFSESRRRRTCIVWISSCAGYMSRCGSPLAANIYCSWRACFAWGVILVGYLMSTFLSHRVRGWIQRSRSSKPHPRILAMP